MLKSLNFPKVHLGLRKMFLILVFLFLYFCNPKGVFASPLTDTMAGYWKFDGNYQDSSGHGNDMASTGIVTYDSDAPSTSFPNPHSATFTTSSYISIASSPNVLRPTSSLTFSLWINPSSYPGAATLIGGEVISSTNFTQGYSFLFQPSGKVAFSVGDGTASTQAVSTAAIPLNHWTHLTGVWNSGSFITLYIDGINPVSAAFSITPSYTSTHFELGRFNGKLDDVRLYSRALGASSEISDLKAGKHLTSSWISTASTSYETAGNWSPNFVPDPFTQINIDRSNSTVDPILPMDESVAGLLIGTESSLDISNYNFTLNDSGNFTNNGTFILKNYPTQHLYNFVNNTNSGTVRIDGFTSTNDLKAGNSYYNLVFAGTANFVLSNDLVVNGNLSFESGALDASTGNRTIIVKKNWLKGSGNFIPGNSTISLSGTNQSISGSNNFYNLQKSVSAADTLTFSSGTTQTIMGNLLLQGAGSASQFLSLRSSTIDTQWKIDPRGTRDISAVDVKDSNDINSSPIILLGRNKNSGNNLNWTFDATPPALVLDPVNSPTTHVRQVVTGIATESNATVSLVSFRVDSTTNTWNPCLAKDGSFDGSSEIFSCRPETDLSDGSHTIYVRSQDSNDVTTADNNFASINFKVDTKPPDISSVSDDPNSDSAKITWKTDENSSSRVIYGKSEDYGKASSEDANVKDHSITIKDLANCTEYHYQVKSKDAAGNEEKSSDHTLKTTGCSTASDSGSDSTSDSSSSSTDETSSPEQSTPPTTTNTTNTQNTPSSSSTSGSANNTTTNSQNNIDFNGSTSTYWQSENFGNAYCLNENTCGGDADPDGDGVSNNDEFRLGTDPNNNDTDQDGATDSAEIENGSDPKKSSQDQGGDSIAYENPKENGTVEKEKYEVKNVELIESDGTKKLRISGKGPPNTYVTVYVYSDPIILTVKTDKDGNWSYVLDQNVGDGEHEVYVAVTDNTGKVEEKSNPLLFIKTAEAVTIIPPAEASAGERTKSPTEAWYTGGIFFFIIIVALGLILALASIGIYKYKMSKQSETVGPQ
jgi:hypothetical protein